MDAYSSYIIKISKTRTAELRREAADFALSATARRRRRQRWAQALHTLALRRPSAAPTPQTLPPQAWASSSSPSSR